jgi:hypothetical protein
MAGIEYDGNSSLSEWLSGSIRTGETPSHCRAFLPNHNIFREEGVVFAGIEVGPIYFNHYQVDNLPNLYLS